MTHSDAGMLLLSLVEVPQVMSAFLPSPTTAVQGGADPERIRWLRRGEVIGGSVALGAALAISLLIRSPLPIIGASFVLALFIWEYEKALNAARANGNEARGFGF